MKSGKKLAVALMMLMFVLGFTSICSSTQAEAASKKFTVKASTKPYKKAYTKEKTYNAKTKQYYMLRSYLERLEKLGGGTLTLKKGTYSIPCTLYVPSNVTIKLSNGTKLKKTTKTGTSKLKATKTMFELVPPSKSNKKKAIKAYKGSKNVKFVGSGKCYIEMSYVSSGVGIVAGHNYKVTIDGIRFRKSMGGSFITVAGSKKVTIQNCMFYTHKDKSGQANRFAIRLEVPDSVTKAFSYKWSKPDRTLNDNIVIRDNTFSKLNGAIGSVKYSVNGTTQLRQKGISITGNIFKNLDWNAIYALNWENAVIRANSFATIANGSARYKGVWACGVVNPTITQNSFNGVGVPIAIGIANNTGAGKSNSTTVSVITDANITALENNTVLNAAVDYIPYNTGSGETKIYYIDNTTRDFVITQGCNPYHDNYVTDPLYNANTKDYFVVRSYLEQLEVMGGGSLTFMPGTYSITNTVYIPSNVTMVLKDGVTINKGTITGFGDSVLPPSKSMFQLVPPSTALRVGSVGGYNGTQNVKVIGEGMAVIDMQNFYQMKAFVLGHNQNIEIRGITFRNMYGHHFMEIDASMNVTVDSCTFENHQDSTNNNKEAINLDTPDANTGGFNQIWTNFDRTSNKDITIKNCTFRNLERAIGTHKYSVNATDKSQLYQQNIKILNNTILNCDTYPIQGMNWKDCVIDGNVIENPAVEADKLIRFAIRMYGVVNPTITNNTFRNFYRIFYSSIGSNSGDGLDSLYPYSMCTISDANLHSMFLTSAMAGIEKKTIRFEDNTLTVSYPLRESISDDGETMYYIAITDEIPTPSPSVAPSPTPSVAPSPTPSVAPSPTVVTSDGPSVTDAPN